MCVHVRFIVCVLQCVTVCIKFVLYVRVVCVIVCVTCVMCLC